MVQFFFQMINIIGFIIKKVKILIELFFFKIATSNIFDYKKDKIFILNFNSFSRVEPILISYKKKYNDVSVFHYDRRINFYKALFSKNKKIFLVKESTDIVNFIFFSNITFDIYDTIKGSGKSFLLEKIEIICFFFIKNLIHRDLRISRMYKKKVKRPRIFIPDLSVINKKISNKQYYSFEKIKILSIGWIDNEDVSIQNSINFFCSRGAKIDIFISEFNFKIYANSVSFLLNKYPSQIRFKKFIERQKLIEQMNIYDFGICPHDSNSNICYKIEKDYYETCGSTRLSDYSYGKLDIILSKKYKFQYKLARSLGLRVLLTENYNKIKDIRDLNTFLIR
jgi:hypothetical protein